MTFFLVISIATIAFLLGFLAGSTNKAEIKQVNIRQTDSDTEKLSEEYRNFLNYDGSEQ